MPYLLNLIYLLLILASLPWLVWQSVRKGKYREGYAAKFLGVVPIATVAAEELMSGGRGKNSRESTTPGGGAEWSGQGRGGQKVSVAVSLRLPDTQEADVAVKKKRLWLHAVSVGEVNLLAPLLKSIEQQRPDWECVISTTTTTGMTLAKKKYPNYTVFYCPLDFTWAVRNAMRRVRPDVLVLAELELWPNLIWAAKQFGANVAVINGRLGEKSFRGYSRIRPLVARLLQQIDLIAAQDETCAERFRRLGALPASVHITGSMKYDGAQTDRTNAKTCELASLVGVQEGDIVLLAGSTQEPEEQMVLEVFLALLPQWPRLRLVLVPRHPERFNAVASLLDKSGVPWQRRTEFEGREAGGERREKNAECKMRIAECKLPDAASRNTPPDPQSPMPNPCTSGRRAVASGLKEVEESSNPQSSFQNRQSAIPPSPIPRAPSSVPRVLLVDVVGELGAWWGTAHIAFVGGSMGSRGGQNMIEPAAFGAAVSFGPNTWNFRDIVTTMLTHDAAVVVEDKGQFAAFVRRCLEDPAYAVELGHRAQSLVLAQLGATEKTINLLSTVLSAAATEEESLAQGR